ncbi:MAG: hypothetical protein RBR35_20025 [Salinivirgaceae bacterium]|nr:hypothetical protein [Salinivirgaceae bacterium]
MKFWHENVDRMLDFQDKNILRNAGSISNQQMEEKVREICAAFDARRKGYEAMEADNNDLQELKELEEKIKKHDQ